MDKRIGFVFILIALIVGAVALIDRINTEQLITEYQNQTGSCYIGGTCLHAQTNTTFIVLSVIAGVIFVIGVIIILFSLRDEKNQRKYEEKEKPEPAKKLSLTSEQKKLYNILLESDGSMLQGELVEKSGMNKVTVSRILDKLEMQNIIERRRHGMSNIVVIKKQ